MITLTMKEKARLEVMQGVMDGRLGVADAGRVLGRTVRSIYRILSKVRLKGIEGVKHGNCGNKNGRRLADRLKVLVLSLANGKYAGFNDVHLWEKLISDEEINVSRETLRQWLRKAGIAAKRKRRRRKYRSRRERKEAFGTMIQIDASHHTWLEGRGPWLVLVGGVDDATGHVWARFEDSESTWAYLRLSRQIIMDEGVPLSFYSDRHTIFHSPKELTIVDQLQNKRPMTQFGRAMDELGIRLIKAWSPQAKGRVERIWGTLQDRLISEMRLANICNKEEANAFLESFLPEFNRRFTIRPKKEESIFRTRPDLRKLDRILCLKDTRMVAKDHTVQFEGLVLQIPPSSKWASIAGQTVEVLQLNDGSIEIVYKNQTVARFNYDKVIKIVEYCGYSEDHVLYAAA